MPNDIFLHLGAHKTATTYMQKLFRSNKKYFDSLDTSLVLKRTLSQHGLHQFMSWRNHVERNLGAKRPAKLERFFVKLASSKSKSVFISYEGLLGSMHLGRSRTIYPAAEQSIELIKKSFQGKNIKVVFCVRGYADFIESTYNWLVKNGSGKSFDEYLSGVVVEELSWKPVVNALRENFGDENVLLWKYEDYKGNYKYINSRLLDFFYDGADDGELSYEENSDKNVSLGKHYMNLMVAINKLINRSSAISPRKKKKLKRVVRKVLEEVQRTGVGRAKMKLLPDETRKTLDDRYKRHLDELVNDGVRFIRV
ncbi:sulfotransferase domain-containing protein [Halomonas heilongjiangensis]|uniref:Sulfotransferase domain-containing protein n=1 Tax=Halomonas heilongjiangensis TaxID=1387883 RepID=A0A2N7TJH4_9GAMM|nr:sulfotransferase domain-containing protein [Halomonas heilongjiangensis]PMR68330.1 hypothetical protein C1H66_15660 [Halomonas heilongjiangensis]PXX89064.1 hypothetical protein CR158_11730 [Halomonas heilongjiangensis]